jgi:RNA polymerase subunit RPABC4/transcription elongation factor Spt4
LITKGHAIIWAIGKALDGRFSDTEIVTVLAGIITVCVAVGTAFLLRSIVRERIFEEHAFCANCNAVDKDDENTCPFCDQMLHSPGSFFVTNFDDEIQLANRLGLILADEA